MASLLILIDCRNRRETSVEKETKVIKLKGMLPPEFERGPGRLEIDLSVKYEDPGREVNVRDGRAIQEQWSSPASFFAEYGFTLLRAPTRVTDWSNNGGQVESIYFPEVEALVREQLFPEADQNHLIVNQIPESFLRRGVGTDNPTYGEGVHQDYGRTAADYEETVAAFLGDKDAREWRAFYDSPRVRSLLVLDFWRTTNMKEPLQHLPMIFGKPSSIREEDIVPSSLVNYTPTGKVSNMTSLRYNPDQEWFWYPKMRPDEVVVFKLFECSKQDTVPVWTSAFHSAFVDPDADPNAQRRQSCENRVTVYFA